MNSRAAAIGLACVVAAGAPRAQPPASATELFVRVGLSAEDANTARAGTPVVRLLPPTVPHEIGAAGALRIRGDLERLVVWLRDIEDFRKAAGTEKVGTFANPARPNDFAAAGDDPPRQLLADYAAAYQHGGDAALGARRDPQSPQAAAADFQDMLRRATTLWNLAYPFASYLETYPRERPPDIEERFYWSREEGSRDAITTLHHVVLQRLADKSLRLADKQIYASRDLDAALLVGQATPVENGAAFDLVVAVRARSGRLGGMAARVLRGRIERDVTETLTMYLDWLRRNYALG